MKSVLSPQQQNQFLHQIDYLFRSGNFSEACKQLTPYQNQDTHLKVLYGLSLAGIGQTKKAAYHLCQAQKAMPQTQNHCCEKLEHTLGPYNLYHFIFEVFEQAFALTPDDYRLCTAYIQLLHHTGRYAKALSYLKKQYKFSQNKDDILNTIGTLLFEAGKYRTAFKLYKILEHRNPNHFNVLVNLALYYNAINNFHQALLYYRKAIFMHPNLAPLRVNYSLCLLKAQHYHQGWIEHEWRLQTPNHSTLPREKLLPTLTPHCDLKGKKILITQEEGLGDTLMYLRFVPKLIEKGADVELWVHETMQGLCERIKGHPRVKTGGNEVPPYDYHCPFISLPRVLTAVPGQDGERVPYLSADFEKIQIWQRKLPQTNHLKIGLVWGGSPHPGDYSAMTTDRKRSIPLFKFYPLLRTIHNEIFISLQMGPYADEIEELPEDIHILNPMKSVHSMEDTAAIIMNLDVILTVDTSMVHLAGGLGKPTILLDRFDNCWRWISDKEMSPWYPNVHIIRQTQPRIWQDVIQKAILYLQAFGA